MIPVVTAFLVFCVFNFQSFSFNNPFVTVERPKNLSVKKSQLWDFENSRIIITITKE